MVTTGMVGRRVQINRLAVDAFTALSQALLRTGYQARSTGGYCCRPIGGDRCLPAAGPGRLSLHSYGIAVDIDPRINPNQKGVTGPIVFSGKATQAERAQDVRDGRAGTTFTQEQIAAVEAIRTVDGLQVFGWGGRWRSPKDAMHFQIVLTPDELRRGIAAQPSPSPSPVPVQPSRPSPAPSASAGRFAVDHVPLLSSHRGAPPALVIGWNNVDASTSAVDVVVHFHGFDDRGMRMNVLLHKLPISGLDFQDPAGSGVQGRTRPTVYLLPRGHNTKGRVFRFPALAQPGALRQLVDDALSQLRARLGAPGLRVDRLILTGHSGGGAGVLGALRHNDPDEVHIFDGLYGPAGALINWALARLRCEQASCSRPWAAMRVLYLRGADTTSHSRAVGRAVASQLRAGPASASASASSLSRRFRVEETTMGHNDIPRTFGWRLLADPAADLPLTSRSPARPRRPARPAPARPAPARPGPTTRQAGQADGHRYVVYGDRVRVDGSRAWRNNNPGNIVAGSFTRTHGAIGSDGRFAVFPDEATGMAAIVALLRSRSYRGKSIAEVIRRYAPPSENDTRAYIAHVQRQTGLPADTIVSSLDEAHLAVIARAIRSIEGWRPGTEYTCANAPRWAIPLLSCTH